MITRKLKLEKINIEGNTQHRPIDEATVAAYCALMKEGVEFPPIQIVFDGKDYWPFDGFHRYHAAGRAKLTEIDAVINRGTKNDAQWCSFAANKDHGLPRAPGTIKKIIKKVLAGKEWLDQTDQNIADHVGTTTRYVREIRALMAKADQNPPISGGVPLTGNSGEGNSSFVSSESPDNGSKKTDLEKIYTSTGKECPEHLREIFARSSEIKKLIADVNALLKTCKDGTKSGDELYRYMKINDLEVQAANVKRNLKFTMPYATCGYCGGDDSQDCTACTGAGWVNEGMHRATPEEMKQ